MLKFIKETIKFGYFLFQLSNIIIRRGSFTNPIKKEYAGSVAILANGPSLKEVIPKLDTDEFENIDFIVMNFFAFSEVFFKIKPEHYCLADPMFYKKNHRYDQVKKLFHILQNNVDWELKIYVLTMNFISFSGINNENISIIQLNGSEFKGFESMRYFFYRKGLSMPMSYTVANMAVYVGLNSGYSLLKLYGADHTFFDSLYINEDNILCSMEKHYYGETELKPVIRSNNDLNWKMSDYIKEISGVFKSHDLLSNYARFLGVKIMNCTKNSMIDSYDRMITL